MNAPVRPTFVADALREMQHLQKQAREFSDRLAEADAGLERMRQMAEAAIEMRQGLEKAHLLHAARVARAQAAYLALVEAVHTEGTMQ